MAENEKSERDTHAEQAYHCYHAGCTGDYFGTCDDCEQAGCAEHIAITSKLRTQAEEDEGIPMLYLCHPCMDVWREQYERRIATYEHDAFS